MPRTIEETIQEVHAIATSKGWWPQERLERARRCDTDVLLANLALAHSEISEAVEDVRDLHFGTTYDLRSGKPAGFYVELADAMIRILDLVGAMRETDAFLMAVEEKIAYNRTRPHRHGGKAI